MDSSVIFSSVWGLVKTSLFTTPVGHALYKTDSTSSRILLSSSFSFLCFRFCDFFPRLKYRLVKLPSLHPCAEDTISSPWFTHSFVKNEAQTSAMQPLLLPLYSFQGHQGTPFHTPSLPLAYNAHFAVVTDSLSVFSLKLT